MNLAEIRKKAAEASKQQSDAPDEQVPAESVDYLTPEIMDAGPLSEWEISGGFQEEIGSFDLEGVEEESESFQVEAVEETSPIPPETPDEFFNEMSNADSEPLSESIVTVAPRESGVQGGTAVRYPAYDPVATILAGRISSAADDSEATAEEAVSVAGDVEEYLCFKVADEEYALSILDIKEIIKPREVTEVPRMPVFISGVISLRGVIIPIMDMRLRLSLPYGQPTGRERVLVLRTPSGFCGVLVDEVIQVVRLKQDAIEGPPAILDGIDREFVMGLGHFDSRMLILLNLESILNLEIH